MSTANGGAPIELWDWQEEAVEELRNNIRAGVMNQILAAPTGSGKTIIATYLIQEAIRKQRAAKAADRSTRRCLFICDRISIIDQTSAVFDDYEIDHGVIQAKHWRWQPWRHVQVASAQTLARRKRLEDVGLIIVDEAHTVHQSVARWIAERNVPTIGLTATPFTRGLGKLYDAVVTVRTLNQLTADGYLAPFRAYSASEPDMTGAKVVAGEWTDEAAEAAAMPIVGDAVHEYLKHAAGKRFIAFGVNVRHCEALRDQFMQAGIQVGLYTYKTPDEERAALVEEFRKRDGYVHGLVSVAALSKGFDVPGVECIIMCRPLKSSLAEHIQILGRGLRRDPENPDKTCIVLDHAGNMARFWNPMHDFFENGAHELDDGRRKPKQKKDDEAPRSKKCPKCHHVHAIRPTCPMCGHEYPRPNPIEHVDGELRAMAAGTAINTIADLRQDVYSQLLWVARRRRYKDGFAAYKFKELFGGWPNGLTPEPKKATRKTLSWIESRRIAFLQEKKAAKKAQGAR